MRTRTRFVILFACIGIAVMTVGVAAIYEAVGRDYERRIPSEAESILAAAARSAIDTASPEASRLDDAIGSLIAARALLAEGRVMGKDAVVRLAIEVAAILGAVLAAAALAFLVLSRLITKGLDELATEAIVAQGDMAKGDWSRRFPRSSDPDLDAVARSLNELLDLTAEQERKLEETARLDGWREVASFLAHQLKNPLAAVLLAAENGRMALDEGLAAERTAPCGGLELARESLKVVRVEADRLRALIDRFRDLAPAGFDAYESQGEFELLDLLADCAARAERSGAAVAITGDRSGIRVALDRGLIEQALWNLFANSIEAADDAGTMAAIEAKVAIEGKTAAITIVDSNRGIDPSLLPRLGFERVSTKNAGTGLGLIPGEAHPRGPGRRSRVLPRPRLEASASRPACPSQGGRHESARGRRRRERPQRNRDFPAALGARGDRRRRTSAAARDGPDGRSSRRASAGLVDVYIGRENGASLLDFAPSCASPRPSS